MGKRRAPKPSIRLKDGRKQPFSWFPNELMRDYGAELGPYAGWVYMALLTHANKEASCWPAHETLATMTGVSIPEVKRSLQKLQRLGLIDITTRRPRTSLYTLLDVPEKSVNSSGGAILPEAPNSSGGAINSSMGSINSQDRAIEQLPQSYEVDVFEVDSLNQTHLSRSSPTPPSAESTESVALAVYQGEVVDEGDAFERFYKTFPKHYGKDEAEVVWKDKKLDRKLDEILTALEWQRELWANNKGGQYTPQPEKYLKDERWLDTEPRTAQATLEWLSRYGKNGMPDPSPPGESKPTALRCKAPVGCQESPGRLSKKYCDTHVQARVREEAHTLHEVLRFDTRLSADGLHAELYRVVQKDHDDEMTPEIVTRLMSLFAVDRNGVSVGGIANVITEVLAEDMANKSG